MAEDYSYERRIVCFIDILGFSNIIKSTRKGEDGKINLKNICCALNMIDNYRCDMRKEINLKDIQTTQFSDSIVISFPWNENDNSILAIFTWIKFLQVFMITEYKMLLRGGIALGDVIHNEKMVVGPAMVDAYILELKCAFSPRIIIDPQVVSLFEETLNRCKGDTRFYDPTIIHKDLDDTFYIDYFNFPDIDGFMTSQFMTEYLKQLRILVKKNEDNEDMGIRVKYLWMRNKIKASNLATKIDFGIHTTKQ